jgi:hypothetical protein
MYHHAHLTLSVFTQVTGQINQEKAVDSMFTNVFFHNLDIDSSHHVPSTTPKALCITILAHFILTTEVTINTSYCNYGNLDTESNVSKSTPQAGKWQSQDLNPGSAVPGPRLTTSMVQAPSCMF